jgi:16S rRNA (cytidine1402-2'-O)-methyltransferase
MHNEHKTIEFNLTIKAGENIALISDAGTPAISDQGFIDPACEEWHNSGMPSGCYFVPALVSGLPNDKFVFEFYLIKGKQTRYLALAEETRDDFMFLLINY